MKTTTLLIILFVLTTHQGFTQNANSDTSVSVQLYQETREEKAKRQWAETIYFGDNGNHLHAIRYHAGFPGGEKALRKYINKNIKYPQSAIDSAIHATTFVSFVVETDGSLTDIIVFRSLGSCFDKEAIRLVKEMPKWLPAENKGKPIRERFTVPIRFSPEPIIFIE